MTDVFIDCFHAQQRGSTLATRFPDLELPLLQFAAEGAEHSLREARDGRVLAKLMIGFGPVVTTTATYEIKRIKRVDSDYFGER